MSEQRDAHRVPPATHWNYLRHPVHAFACPRCHERIELRTPLVEGDNTVTQAFCAQCKKTWWEEEWMREKAIELPFFEGDW